MWKIIKPFWFFCGIFLYSVLYSQTVEVIGGIGNNKFYNPLHIDASNPHYYAKYTKGNAYSFRLAIEEIKADNLTLRLTLSMEKYNGQLEAYDGGLGGGSTVIAEIDKTILSLGLFPINLKIKERIDLNMGIEVGRLLGENFKGNSASWRFQGSQLNYDLKDRHSRLSSISYLGFRLRAAYDIKLNEKLILSPQYSFYIGIKEEFTTIHDRGRSMRQHFSLGLQKKIGS